MVGLSGRTPAAADVVGLSGGTPAASDVVALSGGTPAAADVVALSDGLSDGTPAASDVVALSGGTRAAAGADAVGGAAPLDTGTMQTNNQTSAPSSRRQTLAARLEPVSMTFQYGPTKRVSTRCYSIDNES